MMRDKNCLDKYWSEDNYVLPVKMNKKELKARRIILELEKDFRMSLTNLSKNTGIPVSTIYGVIGEIKKYWKFELVRKKPADDKELQKKKGATCTGEEEENE
ncbi:hypothetical protein LCGC14_3051390 [marine sediment metagenome]|uniref:Uncharacterized protein n=1 Tax=marine sediment metagenome TaxID=412755 RepID=A0A0F8WLI7_9ZZZZ